MRFSRATPALLLAGALLVPLLAAAVQTTHSRSGPDTRTATEDANGTHAARGESNASPAASSSHASNPPATALRNVARRTVAGTFTLWAATPRANPCATRTDAADIHRGAPVTIDDSAGHVLAVSTLSAGDSDAAHRGCVYRFAFTPPASEALSITVGNRVGLTYTPQQIAKAGWQVAMNLGLPDPAAGTLQAPASTPVGPR
jgi:hypothetical protein